MREPRDGLGLAQKALTKGCIFAQSGANDFNCHLAAKGGQLLGAVDLGHAAAANPFDEFIGTQVPSFHASHTNLPPHTREKCPPAWRCRCGQRGGSAAGPCDTTQQVTQTACRATAFNEHSAGDSDALCRPYQT